jgi:polysaccharide biosynthesis protein PslG
LQRPAVPINALNAKIASIVVAAILAGVLGTGSAAARPFVPPGFIGITPQAPANDADFELMEKAGVRSVRLQLRWSSVEPFSPYLVPPAWSEFDSAVALSAEYGMRVFPFVWTTPPWVGPDLELEPSTSRWALSAWASFLRRAVRRYGRHGSFWRHHPELPFLPIRLWEIWNEENIVTFGRTNPRLFARLLRVSGRAIHRADRSAKVIIGGFFGRPLQIPPNVGSGEFLDGIYRAGHVKPFFDGVGLHPYVARARAMRGQILNLRRIMRANHDGGTPLYLTELGWGSDGFESRWERGWRGQARELNQAFSMLTVHRRAWRIGGAWWFTWADAYGGCQFCDSAGLMTARREAKPAWYRFNAWTGGDPRTIPRASLGR